MTIEYINDQLKSDVQINKNQYRLFGLYIKELLRWNKKINLTSITELEQCWEKHIVDSLLPTYLLSGDEKLLDIGSGAGLPCVPLKILFSELNVDSVDSVSKKIHFQRHCARVLQFSNFIAHAERVELFSTTHASQYDVVISRAFSSLKLFIEYAVPFIVPHGRIIAMKGSTADEEIEAAQEILLEYGLKITKNITVMLKPSGAQRVLLEIKKLPQMS
ncbi:MAG: 16S rRNA (guanine(527)-N(7))-methyltransferase RsmG [Thermodesulfobacteriota bacterium]|nr:16S rRNA (guanine(527)-N(7))-methyltransferase RsmG [Thermodesulfobacteriota bacterium]